jgi:hypothetical protein
LISPTLATFDAQAECRRIFKLAFELGRKTGLADAQARIDTAEMQADLWYFIANNPGALAEEKRQATSYLELWEARAETDQRMRAWDADEQLRFDQARAMLTAGMDPVDVAVHLELYLPIVENLKADAL